MTDSLLPSSSAFPPGNPMVNLLSKKMVTMLLMANLSFLTVGLELISSQIPWSK